MSNEMVERVANILADQGPSSDYDALARKVIAAMREPTEAMIDAYNNKEPLSREAYRAMIDAALKE